MLENLIIKNNFITKKTADFINCFFRSKCILNPSGFLNYTFDLNDTKYLDDLESCIVKDLIKMIISSICFEIGLQKNKIIIHFDINKNDFNLDINTNPLHHTIILLALNYLENNHIDYLKNEIILKDVKSIINRHSFELDII